MTFDALLTNVHHPSTNWWNVNTKTSLNEVVVFHFF